MLLLRYTGSRVRLDDQRDQRVRASQRVYNNSPDAVLRCACTQVVRIEQPACLLWVERSARAEVSEMVSTLALGLIAGVANLELVETYQYFMTVLRV